jgi:hypothetical protein
MKNTLPTPDMGGGSNQNAEDPKTAMSGQPESPRTAPWTLSPLQSPSPPPPQPSPPPIRPVAPPLAPSAGNVSRTVVMGMPQLKIPLAWLGVVTGPGAERGRTFVLLAETVIGRNAGDLLLSGDSTVSGQHAKVRLEPKEGGAEDEQVFVLYDLASANGTYAGTRESYSEDNNRVYRYELNNGDYLLLGETVLTFWLA